MSMNSSRHAFAVKWASLHLLACVVVAGVAASVVFLYWYPLSVAPILGVGKIFLLLIAVDVICGPLLTALIAKPSKTRRELYTDLILVSAIQLGALGYGLWSLYEARPVAVVFEVDRLVIVTANQLQPEPMTDAMMNANHAESYGLQVFSLRRPDSTIEYLESLDRSIQGVTPAMRPGLWRPIQDARLEIGLRAKSLVHLASKQPGKENDLKKAAQETGRSFQELRYLPFVSSKNLEWIALLDPSDAIVGVVNVDGFE